MAFITKTGVSNIVGGTLSGPQFCTKGEIVNTHLANEGLLLPYHNKAFVESGDVVAKPVGDLMKVYNDFITSGPYIGLVGVTPDREDMRIPFSYTNSGMTLRRCGYIDTSGNVHTFPIPTSYGSSTNVFTLVKGSVLVGNFMMVHVGDGARGSVYVGVMDITNGNMVWESYTSSSSGDHAGYKYIHTPNWGAIISGEPHFYFEVNETRYGVVDVYRKGGAWYNTKPQYDSAWQGVYFGRQYIGNNPNNPSLGLYCWFQDTTNYNKGWLVRKVTSDPADISVNPVTIKAIGNNISSQQMYLSALNSPKYALALVNRSNWYHMLIDYNGNTVKEVNLGNDSNNRVILMYKNGKYYKTTMGVAGNKYTEVTL